jgi:hypothetical protein
MLILIACLLHLFLAGIPHQIQHVYNARSAICVALGSMQQKGGQE